MKTLLLFVFCCVGPGGLAVAQSDRFDSTKYIRGLPVTEDDTVERPFPDRGPTNVLIRVSSDDVPKGLVKKLDEEEIYNGWREFGLFYERNTGLYVIRTRRDGNIRTYGLNKNGKPVTFDVKEARDTL